MERCVGCGREVTSEWKFCVYCGRSVSASATPGDDQVPVAIRSETPDLAKDDSDDSGRLGQYSGTFWVAVAMGATGLVVIIFAVIQMATTNV